MNKQTRIIYIAILFLFGCINIVNAQDKHTIDSLELQIKNLDARKTELGINSYSLFDTSKANALFELSKIYRDNDPLKAIQFANESLDLSKQINYLKGIGNAYNSLGLSYKNKGDFLKAIDYFKNALEVRSKIDDKFGVAFCYNNIGGVYFSMGSFPMALQNHLVALKIREEINDRNSIASSYNNIGMIYMMQGTYKDALYYFNLALKINRDSGNKVWESANLENIGLTYTYQHKFDEALIPFNESLAILKETDDLYSLAGTYLNIGDAYAGRKNYDDALKNYFNSLKINVEMLDKEGQAISNMSIGTIYVKQKDYARANEFLNKGLLLAKEIGSLEVIKRSYEAMSTLAGELGDHQKALENYKLFIATRDSMYNIDNTNKTVALQLQYQTEKKEQQIKLLNTDYQIKQKQISKKKTERNGLIAGFSLLLMIGGVAFNRYKVKQKTNQQLSAALEQLKVAQYKLIEQEKLASMGQLAAGIAHEIQNPLNFIINFSELSQDLFDDLENTQDEKQKEEILKDLEDNINKIERHGIRADGIIQSMLLHSKEGELNLQVTDINFLCKEAVHLAKQSANILNSDFHCDVQMDFDKNLPAISVVQTDILRVIINILTNAFYAVNEKKKNTGAEQIYSPQIKIQTELIKGSIAIRISDNGGGIPEEIKTKIFQPFFTTKPTNLGTGLGLSISYDIVKSHRGNLVLNSTSFLGSEFTIVLPV